MLHLDPARTNRSAWLGPTQPELAWSFDAGGPIETSPALLPNHTLVFGTLGGQLLAVSSEGQKVFSIPLRERIYASPLVLGEQLFLGADNKRFGAWSFAGQARWTLATDGEVDTAPVLTSYGAIAFAAGPTVYAVRPTGTVLWRLRGQKKFFSSPAAGPDGSVYIGSQDNRLYALTAAGKVRWSLALGGDVDCAPAVGEDDTVYVGTDASEVVAVSASTGSVRWRRPVGGFVRGALTLGRDHSVVAGVYGPSPRVVKLDAKSGEERWSFSVPGTGAKEFGVHGSPVEDPQGNLFFGAQDDNVYALSAEGQLLWKFTTGGDVDASIVLGAPGVLYAASDDGKLYCLKDKALGR